MARTALRPGREATRGLRRRDSFHNAVSAGSTIVATSLYGKSRTGGASRRSKVLVAILSGLIASCFAAEVPAQTLDDRFPLLAQLSVPQGALPPGCSIPQDPQFPIEGVKNRRVTTDPRAFILLSEELTEPFKKHIEAAYYAVYEEGNELGVFGWAFHKPQSAKDAHNRLTTKYPDRFRWWRKDQYVICLWRDQGTTDKCFEAFTAFLQKKVAEFEWGQRCQGSKVSGRGPGVNGVSNH